MARFTFSHAVLSEAFKSLVIRDDNADGGSLSPGFIAIITIGMVCAISVAIYTAVRLTNRSIERRSRRRSRNSSSNRRSRDRSVVNDYELQHTETLLSGHRHLATKPERHDGPTSARSSPEGRPVEARSSVTNALGIDQEQPRRKNSAGVEGTHCTVTKPRLTKVYNSKNFLSCKREHEVQQLQPVNGSKEEPQFLELI